MRDYSGLLTSIFPNGGALHYSLYEGYYKKVLEIENLLSSAEVTGNYSYSQYSELMRRRSVARNGYEMHDFFFGDLQEKESEPHDYSSLLIPYKGWIKEALNSGPGWVLVDVKDQRIRVNFISEHHIGIPFNSEAVLLLDSWEHAYITDFGLERDAYFDKVWSHINWGSVNSRIRGKSLQGSPEVMIQAAFQHMASRYFPELKEMVEKDQLHLKLFEGDELGMTKQHSKQNIEVRLNSGLKNYDVLRQVLAHELVHARIYMDHDAKEVADHGENFMALADKVNSTEGEGYISATGEETNFETRSAD